MKRKLCMDCQQSKDTFRGRCTKCYAAWRKVREIYNAEHAKNYQADYYERVTKAKRLDKMLKM